MNIDDLGKLKEFLIPYLESLKDFHFSFLNPLFWVFLVLLFFVLLRFWEARKSFSFCVIIGAILLATTKIDGMISVALAKSGSTTEPLFIKIASLFLVSIVTLYYVFIKES